MTATGILHGDELARRLAALSPAERASLGRRLADARPDAPVADAITPRDRSVPAPLSYAQELLWLFEQASAGVAAYNVPRAFRVDGTIDPAALGRALETICRRHEVLRSAFVLEGERPVQIAREDATVPVRVVQLRGENAADVDAAVERLLREEARRPFDLERQTLLRALLVLTGENTAVLLLTSHHIATDGWSRGVMLRELAEVYAAEVEGRMPVLAPLAIQYADYATWQRSEARAHEMDADLAWWRERLRGPLPVLALPSDHPREDTTFEGARSGVLLPRGLADALQQVAQAHDVTLFMLLLAALQTLLHRYTGQDDILVGSPIAGRTRSETEPLMGCFANTLVFRGDLGDDPTFAELLARTRAICLSAYEHEDVPIDRLTLELRASGELGTAAPFQVLLTVQPIDDATFSVPGARLTPLAFDPGWAKVDLNVGIGIRDDGLWLSIGYRSGLLAPATVGRLHEHFRTLLEAVAADPRRRLSMLPLLTAVETTQLADWNRTALPVTAATVPELFARQAARVPERIAVVAGGASITYADLDRRANQLAHVLREWGVGPDVPVGLCLDRSVDAIIALIAILKAGGAYIPLVPDLPAARMAQQIAESGLTVLVTRSELAPPLPASCRPLALDREAAALSAAPIGAPPVPLAPDHLAYVLFTSGSTGTPKGVAVTHRNIVNYTTAVSAALGLELVDGRPLHFGSVSTLAADLGNTSVYPALLSGGTLHLVPTEVSTDPSAFGDYVTTQPLDLLKITPSHLRALLWDERGDALLPRQTLVLGGEACPWDLVDRARAAGCAVFNHYGPTETTVGCCVFPVAECGESVRTAEPPPATVPVGRPIGNVTAHVLDAHGQPVPVGIVGELFIGGAGVARGYLNRPDLSAERFVVDRFSGEPGARLYRTGDRVRRLPSGDLEFLGRADDQVKIRGYRVELGEIEAAMAACPGVTAAAVAVRGVPGDQRLAGYFVAHSVDAAALRAHLRIRLPDYMTPTVLTAVPSIPLTANGKRDLRALAAFDAHEVPAVAVSEPPATAEEIAIAEIWSVLLGRDRIMRDDDFFALGGHSLLAMRAIAKLRQQYGVSVPLAVVFDARTVRGMGHALREALAAAAGQEGLTDMLAMLEGMSDEEAARMLVHDRGARGARDAR